MVEDDPWTILTQPTNGASMLISDYGWGWVRSESIRLIKLRSHTQSNPTCVPTHLSIGSRYYGSEDHSAAPMSI